jgi:hypothetical protein
MSDLDYNKILKGNNFFSNIINWFWQWLLVNIFVYIIYIVFFSGFIMIFNIKDLAIDYKNTMYFYEKKKSFLYLQYIKLLFSILLALLINGLCWFCIISVLFLK